MDKRQEQAARLLAAGTSKRAVAKALGVDEHTVRRWAKAPMFEEAVESFKPAELPKLQTNAQTFPRVSQPRRHVKKPASTEGACRARDIAFGTTQVPSPYPGEPSTEPARYAHCYACGWRSQPFRSGAMAQDRAIAHVGTVPTETLVHVDQYGAVVVLGEPTRPVSLSG